MSKLRSIIRHEYFSIVLQKSFWAMMLIIPALIAFIFAVNYFSNKSSADHVDQLSEDLQKVAIIDKSGLIMEPIVTQSGLSFNEPSEEAALVEEVRSGDLSGLVVYPEDLASTRTYQVYLASTDVATMGAVQSAAGSILTTSLLAPLGSPEVISLAQTGASANLTFYKNGVQTGGFNDYVAPGLMVVLFFTIIAFSISFMLVSISEEKENRSMEMVLTYVNPRTLVVGKILGISLVTLTQLVFFLLITVVGYFALQATGQATELPFGIDLTKITLDPAVVATSLALLIIGFLMYAGLMVVVASMAPTAKEANGFSSVFVMGSIIPVYFSPLILTDPGSPIVTFLTYFPLTSPMTSLLRNTVGSLDAFTAITAILALAVFALCSLWLAIRAFRMGALEFAQSVKLSKLFTRPQ